MTVMCPKNSKAFTLIEMVIATAIIALVVIGALDYQYYAVASVRLANTQITAARAAQLLLEDWKSDGGLDVYDPSALNLGFASGAVPGGFLMGQSFGSILNNSVYTITVNKVPMLIVLCWNDVSHDDVSGATLRQLTVMVRWQGQATGGGSELCSTPVILATYVRLDT